MIDLLGWPSLEHRRKTARLAMLFKIRNNIVKMDETMTKKNLTAKSLRARRGQQHNKQYFESKAFDQEYRLGSFFPKTVGDWNELSQDAVDAETLDTFKSRICSEN